MRERLGFVHFFLIRYMEIIEISSFVKVGLHKRECKVYKNIKIFHQKYVFYTKITIHISFHLFARSYLINILYSFIVQKKSCSK